MSVAIVGSSGGGAATLGHTDPTDLLTSIHRELGRIQNKHNNNTDHEQQQHQPIGIRHALFVSLHNGRGLDGVMNNTENVMATLYAVGCCEDDEPPSTPSSSSTAPPSPQQQRPFRVRIVETSTLQSINKTIQKLDIKYITPSILSNQITGLISISSDPLITNKSTFVAAAKMGIPVTGSGGTSLSNAATSHGIKLVGNAGGSVATTTYTRAVSYVFALSDAWGMKYSPFSGGGEETTTARVRPKLGSVLNTSLPAFLSITIICRILEHMLEYGLYPMWTATLMNKLRTRAVPTVCGVVCANSYGEEHGSVVLMAAGIASSVCGGSVLCGLLGGWLVSWLVPRVLFTCIRYNIPATMSNILVGGGVGSVIALLFSSTHLVTILALLTAKIRIIVRSTPTIDGLWDGTGFGFIFGCLFCYGSKKGWYHAVFLPIILLEMERGEGSLWGAVDECTLVLVSAGICAANVITLPTARSGMSTSAAGGDVAVSKRGLRINLLCGDFIEAAYPFMDKSIIVNISGYIASGLATEILYSKAPERVLSSAYVPMVVSVWLAKDWQCMGMACLVAFGVSFVGTVFANFMGRRSTTATTTEMQRNGKKAE